MKKWFLALCIILLLLSAFPSFAQEATDAPAWQAYNSKRIGVLTGTLMEDIAHTYFPDSEYLLLNSYPDCIAALLANKIDAYLGDEPSLKTIHAEQPRSTISTSGSQTRRTASLSARTIPTAPPCAQS